MATASPVTPVYVDSWVETKQGCPDKVWSVLKPGYLVKVTNGIERYIVKIAEVMSDCNYITGYIVNHPNVSPENLYVHIPRNSIIGAYSKPEVSCKPAMAFPMLYDMLEDGIPLGLIKDFQVAFNSSFRARMEHCMSHET